MFGQDRTTTPEKQAGAPAKAPTVALPKEKPAETTALDSSKLVIDDLVGVDKTQNLAIQKKVRETFDWALGQLKTHAPELRKELDREHLTVCVTGDVRRTIMSIFGSDPGKGLDAITITPAIMKNGKPPAISQGNFIILQTTHFTDPKRSTPENDVKALAVLIHESFHLKQGANAPKGEVVVPAGQKEIEIDAYKKEIALLGSLRDSWKDKHPKYAEAMEKVIQEEQKLLDGWLRRR